MPKFVKLPSSSSFAKRSIIQQKKSPRLLISPRNKIRARFEPEAMSGIEVILSSTCDDKIYESVAFYSPRGLAI